MQRGERYSPYSLYFTTMHPVLCQRLEAVGDLPRKVLLYSDSLKAVQGSQYPDRCHPLALELHMSCHSVFIRVSEIWKATISFVMSVSPSASNNSALTGRIFVKSDIGVFFENISKEFNFHYNLAVTTGTVPEHLCVFVIISRPILLRNEEYCRLKL
jgi:hypothetical protein